MKYENVYEEILVYGKYAQKQILKSVSIDEKVKKYCNYISDGIY